MLTNNDEATWGNIWQRSTKSKKHEWLIRKMLAHLKISSRKLGPSLIWWQIGPSTFWGPVCHFFGKLSPRKLDPWKMLVWQIWPLYYKYKGAQFVAPTFSRGLICRGPISQDPICWGLICLKSNWQTTTPPTTPKNPTKNIYHIHQLYIYMYQTQQVNQIYWVVWKIMKSWSRAMLDDSRAFYSHLT